jgi:hypothetical protein
MAEKQGPLGISVRIEKINRILLLGGVVLDCAIGHAMATPIAHLSTLGIAATGS